MMVQEIGLDEMEVVNGGAEGDRIPGAQLKSLVTRAKLLNLSKAEAINWIMEQTAFKYEFNVVSTQVSLIWNNIVV